MAKSNIAPHPSSAKCLMLTSSLGVYFVLCARWWSGSPALEPSENSNKPNRFLLSRSLLPSASYQNSPGWRWGTGLVPQDYRGFRTAERNLPDQIKLPRNGSRTPRRFFRPSQAGVGSLECHLQGAVAVSK